MARWCKEMWCQVIKFKWNRYRRILQCTLNIKARTVEEHFNSMSGGWLIMSTRRKILKLFKQCFLLFCVNLRFRINQYEIFYCRHSARLESGKVELQWFLSNFGNRGDYKLLELFLLPCNQSLLHLKLVKYFVFLKYGILSILDGARWKIH